MIHEVGVELDAYLKSKKCPLRVVDGPEKTTQIATHERIVIERDVDGGDSFTGARSQAKNPIQTNVRLIGVRIRIYAKAPAAGALRFEHERRADLVLDQVLVALYNVAAKRRNGYVLRGGRFVKPEDVPDDRTVAEFPGAVYELSLSFERGVFERMWNGDKRPEVAVADGLILSTDEISINGSGAPPETAC